MTEEPDFIRAKNKINNATSWRGDVNISLGDETLTFAHRLLNEEEITKIKQHLDLSEVDTGANENVGATESQERLLELQQKEELDEEEEEELRQLTEEVAEQTEQMEDAFGDEGYDILMEMGRRAIKPTEEDVEYVYNAGPREMKAHLGVDDLPNPLTKDIVEDLLAEELQKIVSNQPYPIKLNVGLQAFSETISVLGNGLRQ